MDRQGGKDQIQSRLEESVFNSEMDRALQKNFKQESLKIRPECYKNYPDSFVERGSGRSRKKSKRLTQEPGLIKLIPNGHGTVMAG